MKQAIEDKDPWPTGIPATLGADSRKISDAREAYSGISKGHPVEEETPLERLATVQQHVALFASEDKKLAGHIARTSDPDAKTELRRVRDELLSGQTRGVAGVQICVGGVHNRVEPCYIGYVVGNVVFV